MTEEQDAWFAALEEQVDVAMGSGFQLIARLYDFGQLDKLIPLDAVLPALEVPVPARGGIATKRYAFRGSLGDGHMYPEQWVRIFGTRPQLCGHGMVDASFADYDLTGGSI